MGVSAGGSEVSHDVSLLSYLVGLGGEHNYWLYTLLIMIAYNRVVSLSVEVVGKKFWVAGSEVEEIVRAHV